MGGSKRSFHHLPEEIIQEILCHLPSKSLLRFKCVSKRWRSLISNKHFIKHHLKKSSADLSRHKLILLNTTTVVNNRSSHLINHGFKSRSLRSLIEDSNVNADHIPNDYILRLKYYNPATDPSNIYGGREDIGIYYPSDSFVLILGVLGSCNGLILISIDGRNLFIWNPTTRQAKSIAPPTCHEFRHDFYGTRRGSFVCGFGYDVSADEYKIVCIFFCHQKNPHGATEIYSSRTDSWKKIEDFDMVSFRRLTFYSRGRFTHGKFVKGKMHWLADPKGGACCEIVSLDLSEEKYGIVGCPEYFSNLKNYFFLRSRLHELGGYLSLTSFNENVVLGCIDVWVMTKYGETESWVKFWTISDDMMSGHGREIFSCPLMLTTVENGDIVFSFVDSAGGLNVVVYNGSNLLHKSRVDEVFANDCDAALFDAKIYVESLVSPFWR